MPPLSRYHREQIASTETAQAAWDPLRILNFPKQRDLFLDSSDHRVVRAGRSGGKTLEFAVELIDTCLRERGVLCMYGTTTLKDAKDIIWHEHIVRMIEKYQLGAKTDDGKGRAYFPQTGSRIWCYGAKDAREAQRAFRGKRPRLVIVDEFQHFPSYGKDMIQKAVFPASLRAGNHGRVLIGGTSPEVAVGYWHDLQKTEPGWSRHEWSALANVNLNNPQAYLASIAEKMGGWSSPRFRREFLAELVYGDNDNGLCFQYNPEVNDYAALPQGTWTHVIGVDLGFRRDGCAVVVLGICDSEPGCAYLVEEWVSDPAKRKISIRDLAAIIQRFVDKYPPRVTVVDEGGLGGAIADEIRSEFRLPLQAAEKNDPKVGIPFINGDLMAGRLKIRKDSRVAGDMAVLRWDPKALELGELKEAKDPHSDVIPALRYVYKHAVAYMRVVKAPPKENTEAEKRAAQEAEELKRERRAVDERRGWGSARRVVEAFNRRR